MGNAGTNYPASLDPSFIAGYDPDLGPAVQAMQTFFGGYTGPASLTGVTAQSIPDDVATGTIQPASGTVELSLMQLRAGQVINNVSIVTAGTAGSALTHQWAGISSYVAASNGKCLAISADTASAPITADTVITYALSAAYTVPTSGLYYVFYCIAGTTVPTIAAGVTLSAHGRGNVAPFWSGPGDTGKSTPYALAATVTAPTVTAANTLIYLS